MLNGIVFDSDDTIFHSNNLGLETLKEICKKEKIELDVEKYYSLTGLSRIDKAKALFGENNDIWPKWNKAYQDNYKKYAIDLPDAIETLKKLSKRDIKLFIFSTKYSFLIEQALEKFNVSNLFEKVIGGDMEPKKPSPDNVLKILNEYGLTKEEVILIGDSKVDEKASRNIGIGLIQVNYLDKPKLISAKKEIKNLKELLDLQELKNTK